MPTQPTVHRPHAVRPITHRKPHVERVTVENTTGDDLSPPALAGSQPWLRVGPAERLPDPGPGVTARWAVPLTIAADKLPPGEHSGEVAAAAGQPHPEGLKLPVTVQVVPPLDPSPGQLFFGTATVGKPATITFAVRLPAAVPADSLTLHHDLGTQLQAGRTGTEPGRATFTATLTPAAAGMVRGSLRVRCGDPTVPETVLPVICRAVADGS